LKNPIQLQTIHETHGLLKTKQFSSVELTQSALSHIQNVEPHLHALVTVTETLALEQAAQADKRIARGDCQPLTGIPAIIKDLFCTKGIRTTCSSKMLENFIPPYNATAVEKLYANGMVLVGKSNMDEFAMGSSTKTSAFFPTHNPWDLSRVPGGSSGGSAAAVAAKEGLYSLGSDSGGSIRQPASFCSVVGLKPTYGRVSRYGAVPFASSLDHIGPLTQDVEDTAIVMNAISGLDERDSTSLPNNVPDFTQSLGKDIKEMRIGVPRQYFVDGIEHEVESTIRAAILKLEELGANVDWEVTLPHTEYAVAAYYIIAPAEASANLSRYDGIKYGFSYGDTENMWSAIEKTRQYGFGDEVKRRIMLGTHVLSSGCYEKYFLKAQKVRTLISQEFERAFTKYDVLVTPASPYVPFKANEESSGITSLYQSCVCTVPANLAGIPAISVPAGFVNNLPVGMQIMAKPFAEDTLIRVAHAYEQATEWHKRLPVIA